MLDALTDTLRFKTGMLRGLVDGLDDADLRFRPAGGGNCAWWIVGHIATCRLPLGRMVGAELAPAGWEETFDMGSDGDPAAGWPDLAALLAVADERGEAIAAALPGAGELLAATAEHIITKAPTTGAVNVAFLLFHEDYHFGQLGFLRRLRGKPGIA